MADLPLEHAYRPADADAAGPSPAVVVMHGRGADERDLLPIVEQLPDALAAVSLRAPEPLMGGYTWYALDVPDGDVQQSQPEPEGFRRSLDLATESIDAAEAAYDLDVDRLGLLGFSQGAIMAFSMLLAAPDRYAWVAGLHGYLAAEHADREPDGLDGTPVFVGAGTQDRLIPARRAEAAADRLRELGGDVTFETYPVGHGVGQAELVELVAFVERHVD
ncbi:MAG: alpha/beta hydrolase [Halobacteriales archaeon]